MARAETPRTPETSSAAEQSIPLAPIEGPPHKAITAQMLTEELKRVDLFLGLMVLALAVFVASFVARNTDLWMSLASGRLLFQGEYTFGKDPFSFTTEGRYWINHSWLFDLLLYGIASVGGGPEASGGGIALIVFKDVLLVAAAWLMLRTREKLGTIWPSIVCTGISLVAISPTARLQPVLASYSLLALTLWILHSSEESRRPSRLWVLPIIFCLWANLDVWFILGPVTTSLWCLGKLLESLLGPKDRASSFWKSIPLPLVIGVLACLANPHTYHVFALPAPLAADSSLEVLTTDPYFRGPVMGLFDDLYRRQSISTTVAATLFPVMLCLGILSFLLATWKDRPFAGLLVWLPLAILGIIQVRQAGFFFIAAAPITALNFQAFARRLHAPTAIPGRPWKTYLVTGRLLTFILLIGALGYCWDGSLNAGSRDTRQLHRVSWSIELSPSLKPAMEQLGRWRGEGKIPVDARCFHYSPESCHYAAYFAQKEGEKGFLDYRYPLFAPEVAADFLAIRQALKAYAPGLTAKGFDGKPILLPELLRKYKIQYVVLHSADISAGEVWVRLLHDWYGWSLVYLDGRTSIFRWLDPRRKGTGEEGTNVPRLDLNELAFREPVALKSPLVGPERGPRDPGIWASYSTGPAPLPLAGDLSVYDLRYYDIIGPSWLFPYLSACETAAWTSLVGQQAVDPAACSLGFASTFWWNTVPLMGVWSGGVRPQFPLQFRDCDTGPTSALILAVRAARQAIEQSPDDGFAYLQLGNAYERLWRSQEDLSLSLDQPPDLTSPRQRVRLTQLVTAYELGLRILPYDAGSHQKLYETYAMLGNLDMAEEHLEAGIKAMYQTGRRPGEPEEEFRARRERREAELKQLREALKARQNPFEVESANQPLFNKAMIARKYGLVKKALELMLQLNLQTLQPDEFVIILDLHLQMGRADFVLEALQPDKKSQLGVARFNDLRLRAAAAMGNYKEAAELIDENLRQGLQTTQEMTLAQMQQMMFQGLPLDLLQSLNETVGAYQTLAELHTLRGALALEQGDVSVARANFNLALDLHPGQRLDFSSRRAAWRYRELIDAANGQRLKK